MDPNQQSQHGGPSHQTVIVQQQESNALGLAGFIVSLAGWITCGVLCPVGLILSLCALGKRPRGFAIAGVVLGLPGVLFLLVFGFGIVMTTLGIGAAATAAALLSSQQVQLNQARAEIVSVYNETSSLPDDVSGQALLAANLGWTEEHVRYTKQSETQYTLAAPGFDDTIGTRDDITQTWSVDGTLVFEREPDATAYEGP